MNSTESAPRETAEAEVADLLTIHPDLCYDGWRYPRYNAAQFDKMRDQLRTSLDEIDLSRRVFRDPRFRRQHRGRWTAYRLKHVVETWNFDGTRKNPSPRYNRYVCQGSAAAAALLEGFRVVRISDRGPGSLITVPPAKRATPDAQFQMRPTPPEELAVGSSIPARSPAPAHGLPCEA